MLPDYRFHWLLIYGFPSGICSQFHQWWCAINFIWCKVFVLFFYFSSVFVSVFIVNATEKKFICLFSWKRRHKCCCGFVFDDLKRVKSESIELIRILFNSFRDNFISLVEIWSHRPDKAIKNQLRKKAIMYMYSYLGFNGYDGPIINFSRMVNGSCESGESDNFLDF